MSLARYFSVKRSPRYDYRVDCVWRVPVLLHRVSPNFPSHKTPEFYAIRFFYSLALLGVLSSVFFWSAAWNSILKSLSIHISYRQAYLYYWVSYFTDLVVPCVTVCGELTRLYLVQKETNENYGALHR